jgi:hypothetical protein
MRGRPPTFQTHKRQAKRLAVKAGPITFAFRVQKRREIGQVAQAGEVEESARPATGAERARAL